VCGGLDGEAGRELGTSSLGECRQERTRGPLGRLEGSPKESRAPEVDRRTGLH
jgi:hypothetical protein